MTQTQTAAPPEPVDWDLAERVARRFAGREPIAASYLGGSLDSDFSAVTTQAEQLVGDFTGLHAPGTASACVLDRGNGCTPTSGRCAACSTRSRRASQNGWRASPVAPIGRRVAGTEMGVLLGFMAQRVLGQYDLLVPDDPDQSAATAGNGAVYYVGANILALEKRYAFRPRDFRLWIAIHEVTHRRSSRPCRG